MATILVDYENVFTTDGLKGVEYLNEKDTLIVFYSQCCEKIRAERRQGNLSDAEEGGLRCQIGTSSFFFPSH